MIFTMMVDQIKPYEEQENYIKLYHLTHRAKLSLLGTGCKKLYHRISIRMQEKMFISPTELEEKSLAVKHGSGNYHTCLPLSWVGGTDSNFSFL